MARVTARPTFLLAMSPARLGLVLAAMATSAALPSHVAGAPPIQIDVSDGCMAANCHGDLLERPKVHTAVESEMCEACHVSPDDSHTFEPVADPPDLCFECHDPFEGKRYVHEIVAMGECTACHDPHGSEVPQLLVEASVEATCLECHDDPREGYPYAHGPARDGDCLACHQPHHAKYDKLLDHADGALCLTCHAEKQRRTDGTMTRNIGRIIEKAEHVHPPVELEQCLVCHGPHGGVSPPSLQWALPPDRYAPFSSEAYVLCFQCHDEVLATAKESTSTRFRDGERNLHYLHVNKNPKGRSCRICHDPHGTRAPFLLRQSVPFGEWRFPMRYEQTPTGGSCWPGCHQELSYDWAASPE